MYYRPFNPCRVRPPPAQIANLLGSAPRQGSLENKSDSSLVAPRLATLQSLDKESKETNATNEQSPCRDCIPLPNGFVKDGSLYLNARTVSRIFQGRHGFILATALTGSLRSERNQVIEFYRLCFQKTGRKFSDLLPVFCPEILFQ